jgi:hypothetical protein
MNIIHFLHFNQLDIMLDNYTKIIHFFVFLLQLKNLNKSDKSNPNKLNNNFQSNSKKVFFFLEIIDFVNWNSSKVKINFS